MSDGQNGPRLRISKVKGSLDKGYIGNWIDQNFLVQRDKSTPGRLFYLVDKWGEEPKGSRYPEEMQEIAKNRYLLKKVILKRISDNGEKEPLVNEKVWRRKLRTWIPADDLEAVK